MALMNYDFGRVPNLKKYGDINLGWHKKDGVSVYACDKQCTKRISESVWREVFMLFAVGDIHFVDGFTVKGWYNSYYDYTALFVGYKSTDDTQLVEFMFENGKKKIRTIVEKYHIMCKEDVLKFIDETSLE